MKYFSPFTQTMSFTPPRDQVVGTNVSCLLCLSRPSAIFWTIGTIVVAAIQRVLGAWSWPHIFQERRKTIEPTVTDRNSSPAIVGIMYLMRVIATLFHAAPYMIFRSNSSFTFCSMLQFAKSTHFIVQTPAASVISSAQTSALDNLFCATNTTTHIIGFLSICATWGWHPIQNSPPFKCLASQVGKQRHGLFSHQKSRWSHKNGVHGSKYGGLLVGLQTLARAQKSLAYLFA